MRFIPIHIIFIFVLTASNCTAQKVNTDSLDNIINGNASNTEKINACRILGDYLSTKNFDECIDVSQQGLLLSDKQKDISAKGDFKNLMGIAYYFKGNYDSAAIYYYQALDFMNTAGSKKGKAAVLNSLAKLYRKTKDLDRALQNYDEAYAIYQQLKDEDGMATILNESGVVYEYKEDYEQAISRYNRSLVIREKLHDEVGRSYSLNFIGGAYTALKKYAEAEKYLKESLEIRKQLKDTFTLALSYADLGAMYADKTDFEKAIAQYDSSNAIAVEMHFPQLLAENFKTLSGIEEARGNSSLSLAYYKKHVALKDSILNSNKVEQIEELNAKYQAEKKEQQLKLQQFELQKKNYLLWGIALSGLLILIVALNIYRRRKVQHQLILQEAIMKQQDISAKAVIEAEENERKRIAADLHDGVGQMMSAAKMNLSVFENELPFSNEAQKISFENVISMVDESCKEIRAVSHQMMPNALLKSGLASAVREFIDKIDSRVIRISLHTEGLQERLDNNIETVLYRVIQECVNNVLKHSGANYLDISLIKDADGISATIEDNGNGFDITDRQKFEGIGLKNIISRINYLKGTIDFNSAPQKGTLVAIHVPLSR